MILFMNILKNTGFCVLGAVILCVLYFLILWGDPKEHFSPERLAVVGGIGMLFGFFEARKRI